MKKLILSSFALLCLVTCCPNNTRASQENTPAEFSQVGETTNFNIWSQPEFLVVKHDKTGQKYILVTTSRGVCITPLIEK
jgi:hypothetical protein